MNHRASLYRLDPAAYPRDIFRVLPHCPRERFVARLGLAQLEHELGPLRPVDRVGAAGCALSGSVVVKIQPASAAQNDATA